MEKKQETSLANVLQAHAKELKAIAPEYVSVKRLLSLAVQSTMRNPMLRQCSPQSVLDFCMKCAEAGTDRIGAGGMWAIPFSNKTTGKIDMTAIPDWRLIIEKARRAGVITHATAEVVCEKDEFSFERGMTPKLYHTYDIKKPRGEMVAVYCIYTLPDGNKDFVVMSKDEVENIRKKSKAQSPSSPWATDYWEMAKKTVVKRAMKIFEGASPEITKVIDIDNEAVGYEEIDLPPIEMPEEIEGKIEEKEVKDDSVEEQEPQIFKNLVCSSCGDKVKEVVAKYSQDKYGKVLCRECQKKEK